MSWKERFALGAPVSVEHTVDGSTHQFYAVRGFNAMRLRGIVPHLTRALTVIFDDRSRDTGQGTRTSFTKTPGADGDMVEDFKEITIEGTKAEVLKLRAEQKEQALTQLVTTLMDAKHATLMAEIIMDCMRESFPENDRPTPDEFLKTFDLIQIKDMVIGVAKANAKVFGNFSKAMASYSARALAKAQQVADEGPSQPESKDEVES